MANENGEIKIGLGDLTGLVPLANLIGNVIAARSAKERRKFQAASIILSQIGQEIEILAIDLKEKNLINTQCIGKLGVYTSWGKSFLIDFLGEEGVRDVFGEVNKIVGYIETYGEDELEIDEEELKKFAAGVNKISGVFLGLSKSFEIPVLAYNSTK